MKLLNDTRQFRLVGGPWADYTGEFIEKDQATAEFHGFIYVRSPRSTARDARVEWIYDEEQTDRLMLAKGINPRTGNPTGKGRLL